MPHLSYFNRCWPIAARAVVQVNRILHGFSVNIIGGTGTIVCKLQSLSFYSCYDCDSIGHLTIFRLLLTVFNMSIKSRLSFLLLLLGLLFPTCPALALSPQQQNQAAVQLMEQQKFAEALPLLREAHAGLPFNDTIRHNLVQGFFGLAQQLMSRNQYEQALAILEEGADLAPNDFHFPLLRGLIYLNTQDYIGAENELAEARSLNDEDPQVYFLSGHLYYATGRLEEAVQAWEEAQRLDPQRQGLADLLAKARKELAVEENLESRNDGHFIISYEGETQEELGGQVLDALEDAYGDVGAKLEFYPSFQVPVLLYTRKDFLALTGSPDWAGGAYDGKIRLPVGGLRGMTPQLRALLFHEYTHVLVYALSRNKAPLWLNEGLAEVMGREEFSTELTELVKAAGNGGLIGFDELDTALRSPAKERARLAYEQSYDFARFLVDNFGWFQIKDMLALLGQGKGFDNSWHETIGLYAVSPEEARQQWRSGLLGR